MKERVFLLFVVFFGITLVITLVFINILYGCMSLPAITRNQSHQ